MIDRKVYLDLCQKCAALPERFGIKYNVPDEWRIVYRESEYYPIAYQLSFSPDGAARHIAVLHDIAVRSVIYTQLNKIDQKEERK